MLYFVCRYLKDRAATGKIILSNLIFWLINSIFQRYYTQLTLKSNSAITFSLFLDEEKM